MQKRLRDVVTADRISDGVVERNADSSEDERAMKAGGESLVEDRDALVLNDVARECH